MGVELAGLTTGLWAYSASMPRIPALQVGWLPVLYTMMVPFFSAALACPERSPAGETGGDWNLHGPQRASHYRSEWDQADRGLGERQDLHADADTPVGGKGEGKWVV